MTDSGPGVNELDADINPNPTVPTSVDLLFVIEGGCSMRSHLGPLLEGGTVLLRELVSPEVDPETGEERVPIQDLHVGLINDSMPTPNLPGCDETSNGSLHEIDDCLDFLENFPPECATNNPCRWLSHSEDWKDDGTNWRNPPIWDDWTCLVREVTGCTCGWAQPLDAAMAALTTVAEPGTPNHGFFRDDALLVVILITDEDDYSVADPRAFDHWDDHQTWCVLEDPATLRSTRHYIETLRALRDPTRFLMAAVAGAPTDGSWVTDDPPGALRALQVLDPNRDNQIRPVCTTSHGLAEPAPRIAEVVLGLDGLFFSACEESWAGSFVELASAIRRMTSGR